MGRPEQLRLMPPRSPSGRFLPAGPPLDPRSAGARVARQLLRQARQASGLLTAPRQRGLDGASTARQLVSQGSSEKCRERPLPPLYPRPVCGHAHGSEFSHIASGAGGAGLAPLRSHRRRRHGSTLASSPRPPRSPGAQRTPAGQVTRLNHFQSAKAYRWEHTVTQLNVDSTQTRRRGHARCFAAQSLR